MALVEHTPQEQINFFIFFIFKNNKGKKMLTEEDKSFISHQIKLIAGTITTATIFLILFCR